MKIFGMDAVEFFDAIGPHLTPRGFFAWMGVVIGAVGLAWVGTHMWVAARWVIRKRKMEGRK
ncbi:MAG: hypothetical protein GY851_21790 [bacterium]|nr:hypothetical protein [bacterium]